MVTALLIAVPAAGWLVMYIAYLGGPRLGKPRRRRQLTPTPDLPRPGTLAQLVGQPERYCFAATLLDLSARGWFGLSYPSGPGPGRPDPSRAGPLLATLPPEPPSEQLTAPERRAIDHLARRAGTQRTFPADALMDGFAGGESDFMDGLHDELIADCRARGLSRPTLSARRKTALCLVALVAYGAALLATARYHHHGNWFTLFSFTCATMLGLAWGVSSERLTESGEAALIAAEPPAGVAGREIAYALALGLAATPLMPPDENTAWSGFGDTWRLVPIGDTTERTWPGITNGAVGAIITLIVPGVPAIFAITYAVAGVQAADLSVLGTLIADGALFARAYARWSHLPRYAEFTGLVIRQWVVGSKDSDDGPDYYVAIDDGTGTRAWAFKLRIASMFDQLTTGTIARVRVNPRLNRLLGIEPLHRLPTAPLLADTVDPRAPDGGRAR